MIRFGVLKKVIKNYSTYSMNEMRDCKKANSNEGISVHYCVSYMNNHLIQFDQNWNFKSLQTLIRWYYMDLADDNFYGTTDNKVLKINFALNVINSYNRNLTAFRGIYYYESNRTILAAVNNNNEIIAFDLNLNLLFNINTQLYTPRTVSVFNGKIYVGATNGTLLVIQNNIIFKKVTSCTIASFVGVFIDTYGHIAALCHFDKLMRLYDQNLQYLGSKNLNDKPLAAFFDLKNQLVVSTQSGIEIYIFDK